MLTLGQLVLMFVLVLLFRKILLHKSMNRWVKKERKQPLSSGSADGGSVEDTGRCFFETFEGYVQ